MTADCTITTDRQCSPCVAPTFSDDGLTCKQCDGEGKYNDEDGAAFCKTAKAGYKPTSDHKVRMNLTKLGLKHDHDLTEALENTNAKQQPFPRIASLIAGRGAMPSRNVLHRRS